MKSNGVNIDHLNYSLLMTLENLQNVIKNLEERVHNLEKEMTRGVPPQTPPETL